MRKTVIKQFISDCYEYKAIKFGDFVLKTGIHSPIYLDIRTIVNTAKPLKLLSDLIYEKIESSNISFDLICGVPYTALSIASCISIQKDKDMITKRKETKDYGTKQMIEGLYSVGQKVVIIEDIISSGSSILETTLALRSVGLEVTDAVVFIDRQQNGISNMKEYGIDVHSLIDIKTILQFLKENNRISSEVSEEVLNWIKTNPLKVNDNIVNESKLLSISNKTTHLLSFEERSELSSHPLAKSLFALMAKKKSNLCVAIDLVNTRDVLKMAQMIGQSIVVLKLHVDAIEDFDYHFIEELKAIAEEMEFFIFEDRKYADIGNTVKLQYTSGIFKTSCWAHLVNAHLVSGPSVIEGLRAGVPKNEPKRGCLLVASMSSEGNQLNANSSQTAYKWSKQYSDFVIGFICQSRVSADQTFIHMTPGVKIESSGDGLGQQYITPEEAVLKRGADLIIVGRGVTSSSRADEVAKLYQQRGFNAYLERNN